MLAPSSVTCSSRRCWRNQVVDHPLEELGRRLGEIRRVLEVPLRPGGPDLGGSHVRLRAGRRDVAAGQRVAVRAGVDLPPATAVLDTLVCVFARELRGCWSAERAVLGRRFRRGRVEEGRPVEATPRRCSRTFWDLGSRESRTRTDSVKRASVSQRLVVEVLG